jgi:hypothetical protein
MVTVNLQYNLSPSLYERRKSAACVSSECVIENELVLVGFSTMDDIEFISAVNLYEQTQNPFIKTLKMK